MYKILNTGFKLVIVKKETLQIFNFLFCKRKYLIFRLNVKSSHKTLFYMVCSLTHGMSPPVIPFKESHPIFSSSFSFCQPFSDVIF